MDEFTMLSHILLPMVQRMMQILTRVAPSGVAEAVKHLGATAGFLIDADEAYDTLVAFPDPILRKHVLAISGNHIKLERAIDKQDKETFVALCEEMPNSTPFLSACGMLLVYTQASAACKQPENRPTTAEEMRRLASIALAYQKHFGALQDGWLDEMCRQVIMGALAVSQYGTAEERQQQLDNCMALRAYEHFYCFFLELAHKAYPDLQPIRKYAREHFGDDEVERRFLKTHTDDVQPTETKHFPLITEQCIKEGKVERVEQELRAACRASARELWKTIHINEALGYLASENLTSQTVYDYCKDYFGLSYSVRNFTKYRYSSSE